MSGSMVRYESHAQLDGTSIIFLMNELLGIEEARRRFLLYSEEQLLSFESEVQDQICEFLAKTESQRPAYCRRLFKEWDRTQQAAFLVLCFLATKRVAQIICFRDFAGLEPGGSYRTTTARIYDASQRMDLFYDYSWPSNEVFNQGFDDGADHEGDLDEYVS